jgi:UDP-GlcNAc:undecaprenyl-phosphate GlcNAc-1-phosphate transferase
MLAGFTGSFALGVAVACGVSLAATAVVARLARRWGLVDRPSGYKAHPVPTPLLGGVAVAAGALAGILSIQVSSGAIDLAGLPAIGAGGLVILAAGLLDDIHGLSARHKFAWQLAAAAGAGVCLAVLGVRLDLFLMWPRIWIVALTVLWVVAITNAVNFLDNMDGLCVGLGAIAAAALGVANARSGELAVAAGSAALCGACLGFLPFNWPRARIFLGDAGAMFIGFLLSALSVLGVYTPGAEVPVLAVCTPLFALAVPVLDLVLVVALRFHAGHPVWVGDRRHISHRLVHRGMRPAAAVATLWAAGAACGFAALLLPTVGPGQAPLLVALVLCALGVLAAAAGSEGLQAPPGVSATEVGAAPHRPTLRRRSPR